LTARLLAATKFSVPALPGRHVPRPRLHAALDAAAQLPLTVVVGVPGAGKSVMLESWLHDRPGLRSAWLSCDAWDADPVTFWLAVSAALTQTWPGRWLDVADLLAEEEPDLDDVAIAVVNDLADLGEPVVLVIDDFQFAAAAAPSLSTLIGRLPAGCRVVVASRTEPQLALHRLRRRAPPCSRRRAQPIPGVAQLLADDALEGLATPGPVEAAQHVVQGPVLEEHQHHMVQRISAGSRAGHASLQSLRTLRESPAAQAPTGATRQPTTTRA
jgi:hypothetical protein